MPCNTIDARLEPCKEYLGGIQGIFLIPFTWSDVITIDAGGTVSKIAQSGGVTLVTGYFWELKGSSSFEDAVTSSRENGTTFHETTLSVVFKPKGTSSANAASDTLDLNTLAQGRWRVVVWDRNDNFWLLGEEFGCDVSTGAESWGTALGDPRTYTATFMAQEKYGPRPLASVTYAGLSTIFTADATPA
jgi:hypothetical protein